MNLVYSIFLLIARPITDDAYGLGPWWKAFEGRKMQHMAVASS